MMSAPLKWVLADNEPSLKWRVLTELGAPNTRVV